MFKNRVLESTFARVPKMFSATKFQQNVREMRLIVEDSLKSIMRDGNITSMEELVTRLERAAIASKKSTL